MFLNEKDLRMSEERRKDLWREAKQERLAKESRRDTAQNAQFFKNHIPVDARLVTVLARSSVLDRSEERQKSMCDGDRHAESEQPYRFMSNRLVKGRRGVKPTTQQYRT